MKHKNSLFASISSLVLAIMIAFLFIPASASWAKRPPEIRNQEELNISKDMHGQDLSGLEFVKFDLRNIDFSQSDLTGAVFNNSNLSGAIMTGSDMHDSLAYATNFDDADLSDVNFTNALLMESSFDNAAIKGADFTDAVISRIQQKQLCSMAEGENSTTGVDTSYSLGC
ncbi:MULTISPECIES: pentapeptide repeat-containing protein [Prochlorococcus]|uniref:pentapeptide repeat-containing protein n=1 Tax=Prochlorococcus TaxID=1218 RepID=UPI0005338869|nr:MULTISPECIES: pentapeptide repeat-containing protein [Prochlorococcus]KGG12361.1 putative lumenal protein [Prochlorococcus sp. MIT 0601]